MPHDEAAILAQVQDALRRWQRQHKLGEIAIVCGPNDFEVQERPMTKHKRVRRETKSSSLLETVTEP